MLMCVIFVLLGVMWMYPTVWFRYIKNSLYLSVRVDHHFVEIGDEIYLECIISNQSRMPCPRFTLSIDLPDGLESVDEPGLRLLRLNTSLKAHESLTCHAVCKAVKRGFYAFENLPALLVVSEGFGLRQLTIQSKINENISVFPPKNTMEELLIDLKEISGMIEVNRWIHPDEARLQGIRTYNSGDSFKHIAWNASASTGQWMVKQFTSSTEARVHLILNAQFYEDTWIGTRVDEFDALCSYTEITAQLLSEKGFQLHFATNATFPGNAMLHYHGPQTAAGIRLILARLSSQTNQDFEELIHEATPYFMPGDQIVLFSSFFTENQQQMIETIRRDFDIWIISGTNLKQQLGVEVEVESDGYVGVNAKSAY